MLPDLDDPGENRRVAGSTFRGIPVLRRGQCAQHQPAGARWQAGAVAVRGSAAGGGCFDTSHWLRETCHRRQPPPRRFIRSTPDLVLPAQPVVPGGDPAARDVPCSGADSRRQGALAAPSPSLPRLHARIRVDAGQLDDLVGLAGELVVVTDNLLGLREIPGVERWMHALEALERVSREIRDTTLDLRMVPVDELFSRFPRVVRDLADRSGKEIELRIIGQETRLDRTIVERLSDPMIHLIRNGVDHALELPQERVEKGKPRVGRITLSAGHEGDRVAIRVEDDGRGLDCEKNRSEGHRAGDGSDGNSRG